jgi:hypothetical protein
VIPAFAISRKEVVRMTSAAPMHLDQHEGHDGYDQATEVSSPTEVSPAATSAPSVAPARTQAPGSHIETVAQQPVNTSWGVIVLATLALLGGLGLWTIVAVSGTYFGWLVSVGVMGVLVAVTFVAIKHADT